MANEIVVTIQPFALQQDVYLFNGLELVNHVSTTLGDLTGTIISLSKESDAPYVLLKGEAHFAAKVKDEIEAQELTQFGLNSIVVELAAR